MRVFPRRRTLQNTLHQLVDIAANYCPRCAEGRSWEKLCELYIRHVQERGSNLCALVSHVVFQNLLEVLLCARPEGGLGLAGALGDLVDGECMVCGPRGRQPKVQYFEKCGN